jgi:hypothetical protein
VIDEIAAVSGELLPGWRCRGYNQRTSGKLLTDSRNEFFDSFDFTYGYRVDPDRAVELRQLETP